MGSLGKTTTNYLRSLDGEIRLLSDEKRQVELSFSSEQPYERWFGTEILCHDASSVNLARLQEVGSLLFHHGRDANYGSLPVGRIVSLRLDDDQKVCRATVEFDEDEKSDLIYQKVRSGSIRGVSVGYRIDALEEVKPGKLSSNGRFTGPCSVGTRWTPYEISIEPTPADDSVGIGRTIQTNESEESNMEKEKAKEAAVTEHSTDATGGERSTQVQTSLPNVDSVVRAALQEERARVTEIEALCRSFGLPADSYIQEGKSVEEARAGVLEQLQKSGQKPITAANIEVTADEEDKFRLAARDGQLARMGFSVNQPAAGAEEFRGCSLRSLAATCLQRAGQSRVTTMDDGELLKSALGYDGARGEFTPNSAFVSIVNNTLGAVVSRGYQETPTSFQQWTGKGSNPNFKATKRYRLSAAGEMVEIKQGGEFKTDTVTDEGIDTRLKTYGKRFGFTRQAFIDDDLGTIAKAIQAQVRSCKRTINKKVYALLGENQAYMDRKALFHADHSNLGKAGSLSIATLGELYVMMSKQQDLSGRAYLNIAPKYLIVPATLSMDAFRLLRSASDPGAPNAGVVNPVQNLVEIITDAELDRYSETAFYLAASPADVDTVEVAYLNGKEEPTLENRVAWDTLGIDYRMFHDFAVSLLDYRGLSKNAGSL